MCEIFSWNWSGIIPSITGLITVYIAYVALTSWKKQHKSQRVTKLLDELTDSIHELVQCINVPIQHLMIVHIGLESYKHNTDLNKELAYPEAVSFIEKEGKEYSECLIEALENCEKTVNKLRSLVVKGQVYGIKNYNNCQNACNKIIWQFDRLQVVSIILGSRNMNWEHPKVIKQIKTLLEINPESIESHLKENQKEFIKFVKNAYENEYSNA